VFAFQERALRLERRFKGAVLLATALSIAGLLWALPWGRYAAGWLGLRARYAVTGTLGWSTSRDAIEAEQRLSRAFEAKRTRAVLEKAYAQYKPPMRNLLRFAGLDPDHALLRVGNFNRILLLPSSLFEPDDHGRSYRMRPNTTATWIRNLRLTEGILAFFMVPETAALKEAVKATGALIVSGSSQTTNSWGLRGPEPDMDAPVRGIVLGDSFMQGIHLRETQTPPECLRTYLQEHLQKPVAILNTGHLGYSPEQYYFTLREYADRFRPQFVVVSVFANDFGDLFDVLAGKADWEEGRYWLEQIQQFCAERHLGCLVVPAPWVNHVAGPRETSHYPGQVANITGATGSGYLDPTDDFVNAHLELLRQARASGTPIKGSPLFLGELADGHFSALGSIVWGNAVGKRIELLMQNDWKDGP
jgi:hypothetical protein